MHNADTINKQSALLPWAYRIDDTRLLWRMSNSENAERDKNISLKSLPHCMDAQWELFMGKSFKVLPTSTQLQAEQS